MARAAPCISGRLRRRHSIRSRHRWVKPPRCNSLSMPLVQKIRQAIGELRFSMRVETHTDLNPHFVLETTMASSTSSSSRLLALLGLLAVAGYQHRDRIGEWLGKTAGENDSGSLPTPAGQAPKFESGDPIGNIVGGLRDLFDKFTGTGQGDTAKSWIETGPNRTMEVNELERALGDDTIEELTKQTGLSRNELLSRLKTVLPNAVDRMTPEGHLPTEAEAARFLGR